MLSGVLKNHPAGVKLEFIIPKRAEREIIINYGNHPLKCRGASSAMFIFEMNVIILKRSVREC